MATLTEPPLYTLPFLSLPPLFTLCSHSFSFVFCRLPQSRSHNAATCQVKLACCVNTDDTGPKAFARRGKGGGQRVTAVCPLCTVSFLAQPTRYLSLSLSSHATMRRLRSCYFLQFSPFRRMSLCVSQGGERREEDREIKWEICVRAAHTLWQPF